MEIPSKYKNRCFYHFTHLENIESIVENGLLATNEKKLLGLNHINLANENIQYTRSGMKVTCSPFGRVHDYVPFYFAARNPMLLSVLNRKNIDQPLIVYIAISIEKLLDDNVVFTDRAANTEYPPEFFSEPKDLDKLDWNLIDTMKWGRGTDEELHYRMAEVLVYKKVPIDWIESYIVFNEYSKLEIENIYRIHGLGKPKLVYQPFKGKWFYYTKYFFRNRTNENLITGPVSLNKKYKKAIQKIIENRDSNDIKKYTFIDIKEAVRKIENNFCIIKELEGIYELETDNKVHSQNVSDHTVSVVRYLNNNNYYYKDLFSEDKLLVKLSAYLHDIGKGPRSKWGNGIQKAYADHPADAIPMIIRILSEDFKDISEYQIRKICLLVAYHDLIGDIIYEGRSKKELVSLNIDENELNMLLAITLADISSIEGCYCYETEEKASKLKEEISSNDRVCIW